MRHTTKSKPTIPFSSSEASRKAEAPLLLQQLDLNAFQIGHPPLSKLAAQGSRFLRVHLLLLLKLFLFLLDEFVVLFLLPGFADRWMGGEEKVLQELAIPFQFQRYLYLVLLLILLVLRVYRDLHRHGFRVVHRGRFGEIMANSWACQLSSLGALKRYRFYRYVFQNLDQQHAYVGWVLWAGEGWRRFLLVKTPLFLLSLMTFYNALSTAYVSPVPAVRTFALTYLALQLVLYVGELLLKLAAVLVYVCWLRRLDPGLGGLTLYYRNVVSERALLLMRRFAWAATASQDSTIVFYEGHPLPEEPARPSIQRPSIQRPSHSQQQQQGQIRKTSMYDPKAYYGSYFSAFEHYSHSLAEEPMPVDDGEEAEEANV